MTIAYAGNRLAVREKQNVGSASGMSLVLSDQNVFTITPSGAGLRIYCQTGRLWLTQAGDATDYIIGAGESFTARGKGTVVVQAVEASTLHLATPPVDR